MTHAQQEQQLLDYFAVYRDTINLKEFTERAKISRATLRFFLDGERGLSPEALSKCQAMLKAQAQALQSFLTY